MNEPLLHAAATPAEEQSLWNKAPAWRNLVVTASLLTTVALALPLIPQATPSAPPATAAVPKPHANATATKTAALAPAPMPVAVAPVPAAPAPLAPKPVHHAAAQKLASLAPAAPQPAPVPQPATPATASTQAAPATNPNVCLLVMQPEPIPRGSGTVFGFWTLDQIHARIAMNQASNGGTINPNWRDTPRAMIKVDGDPNPNRYWISAVPDGMQVHLGDHVYFQSAYRDSSLPCSFIPTMITHDDGRLQQSLPMQAPMPGGAHE